MEGLGVFTTSKHSVVASLTKLAKTGNQGRHQTFLLSNRFHLGFSENCLTFKILPQGRNSTPESCRRRILAACRQIWVPIVSIGTPISSAHYTISCQIEFFCAIARNAAPNLISLEASRSSNSSWTRRTSLARAVIRKTDLLDSFLRSWWQANQSRS